MLYVRTSWRRKNANLVPKKTMQVYIYLKKKSEFMTVKSEGNTDNAKSSKYTYLRNFI